MTYKTTLPRLIILLVLYLLLVLTLLTLAGAYWNREAHSTPRRTRPPVGAVWALLEAF